MHEYTYYYHDILSVWKTPLLSSFEFYIKRSLSMNEFIIEKEFLFELMKRFRANGLFNLLLISFVHY